MAMLVAGAVDARQVKTLAQDLFPTLILYSMVAKHPAHLLNERFVQPKRASLVIFQFFRHTLLAPQMSMNSFQIGLLWLVCGGVLWKETKFLNDSPSIFELLRVAPVDIFVAWVLNVNLSHVKHAVVRSCEDIFVILVGILVFNEMADYIHG
jgi:hypothetical protein